MSRDQRLAFAHRLEGTIRTFEPRLRDVTVTVLDAIRSVSSSRAMARLAESGTMCRGVDMELELDGHLIDAGSAYLFASVVERFLGLYASINAFSRLGVRLHGRGDLNHRWPARAGDRPLL